MMKIENLRKSLLYSFVGFLSLTAIIAIFTVLFGEFGELQVKILITTLTISAASICSMSCAAFLEKRGKGMLGISGITAAVVAAAMIIAGIWWELDHDNYWKSTLTAGIIALSLAHAFLLSLPVLQPGHRWTQAAAYVCIGLLDTIFLYDVWIGLNGPVWEKYITVLVILVGLLTLVIPILMRLRGETQRETTTLLLKRNEDGIYEDSRGNRYEVRELK